MADSIRASTKGLAIANERRLQKGWGKSSIQAYQQQGCRTSGSTLKRFWQQKAILQESFMEICQALELNWQTIAEDHEPESHGSNGSRSDQGFDIFDSILAVALSPDGKFVIGGDTQGQLLLWRVDSSQFLGAIAGHQAWVRFICFDSTGQKFASSGNDHCVKVWDFSAPEFIRCLRSLEGHLAPVWTMAFAESGRVLVSGSDDCTVRVWDVNRGVCLHTMRQHQYPVRFVGIDEKRGAVISFSGDQVVKRWQVSSPYKSLGSWQIRSHEVRAGALCPSGDRVASGSDDQDCRVRVLDVFNEGKILSEFEGHNGRIWSVIFHPTQPWLISGDSFGRVKVWDLNIGQCLATYRMEGRVRALALDALGQRLVAGTDNQAIRVWDLGHQKDLAFFRGITFRVWAIALLPDSIVSGGDDGKLTFWDHHSTQSSHCLSGHDARIRSIAMAPNSRYLASTAHDLTVRLWDLKTQSCIRTFHGHQDWIWKVMFSHNGRQLISLADDHRIKIWCLRTGQCLQTLELRKRWTWGATLHPHQWKLALADEDRGIYLWNLESKTCEGVLHGHEDKSQAIAFTPKGDRLISAGHDEQVIIWDLATRQCVSRMAETSFGALRAIAIHPKGELFATAGDDGVIYLWDMKGHQQGSIDAHDQSISSLMFYPQGFKLVSGSEDGTVKVWNLSKGNRCIKIMRYRRPYEGIWLETGSGLTPAEVENMKRLGATFKHDSR